MTELDPKLEFYFETLQQETFSPESRLAIDGLRAVLYNQRNTISDLHEKNKNLNHLASTDSLTLLKNRRAFDDDLRQWERILNEDGHRREDDHEHHALLVIGDLDNFKLINDVLGYDCGDRVLVITACALESSFRQSDSVYRLGGDEFAGIASVRPGSEAATYEVIMERFYTILEHLRTGNSSAVSHRLTLSDLDREALRTLDVSFAYSTFETGFSEESIAETSNMTMQNVKRAKDEKCSVR